MRKATRYSLLITLALVAALAAAVILRKAAPPEAARLLPESDAIVFANLRPIRTATHFDQNPVPHTPEYQHFIDATGILPERDLDSVAFALHRMDDPSGPNGPVAWSEVFEGRFDGDRLARYLASIASSREQYAGHDVYTIPVGEPNGSGIRHLRVAQLGYDTIAASNMPTAEQIHSMLDRHRAAASPFAGSSLLSAHYTEVPLLSSAWAIGHIGLPFSERGKITLFGLQLPLAEDTTFVASLRYVGSLHLRIEQIAPTDADALTSTQSLTLLLSLLRNMQLTPQTPAAVPLRQTLDSVKIDERRERVVLTATIPVELVRQLATPPPTTSSTELPPPPAHASASR